MANVAVPPPDGLSEPEVDLAPGGGLPFGKVLARLAKVPLRRWKTSLTFCVISAAVAFAAGKTLSQTSYPAEGKLLYRPSPLPDNLRATGQNSVAAPAH